MYKYAEILDGNVHCIMEHEADLKTLYDRYFPKSVVLVDITKVEPQPYEGWLYNGKVFTPSNTEDFESLLRSRVRGKRDDLMNDTAYVFQRQLTASPDRRLSEADYAKWLSYWDELRDFPQTCDLDNPVWPIEPMT